ncbi:hypothetical protein ACIO87_35805 [Streptomyces sp. NPDC087218]|uniref:hypothetical protein n=1 Tax=Streptomyces sp. NPDC087218 TaxID=3365769 RepID=UPI003815358C
MPQSVVSPSRADSRTRLVSRRGSPLPSQPQTLAAGLDGAAVVEVRLEQVADVLERYPLSALQACRTTPAAEGGDVADELLDDYAARMGSNGSVRWCARPWRTT